MTSLNDFGVLPSAPGQNPDKLWVAMLHGGRKDAVTFCFAEQPEDRAIEGLLAHVGAVDALVRPPKEVA